MSLPLQSIVANVAGIGFSLASEIVASFTYYQHKDVAYNPADGNVPVNDSTTDRATVSAIVGKYSIKETDGQNIRFGDEKLLVKASELGAIVPNVDDYFLSGTLKRLVVSIDLDPTGTLYTFQVRKASA